MPTPEDIVKAWHDAQPHPLAPMIKVGEYATAARLASLLKFGTGHASPPEVEGFWKEFGAMNQRLANAKKMPLSPTEFEELAVSMAKVSFAFHGRPPSMAEITRLREAHPKDIHDYFSALPDEHYPHVTAGDMVKSLQKARPWSEMLVGRSPSKLEASYLHHSGHNPAEYYKTLKAQQDSLQQQGDQQQVQIGSQDRTRGYPGSPGAEASRGPQTY